MVDGGPREDLDVAAIGLRTGNYASRLGSVLPTTGHWRDIYSLKWVFVTMISHLLLA